jgi:RNA polymerase sigma-70 factor (ECF subfamily)
LARLRIKKHWRARFDASDVVQDSLLKAFRTFESFRGHTEDDLLLWLRGILVNSLCNVGRRSERSNYRSVELKKSLIDKLNDSSVMLGQRLVDHYTPSKSALEHEQSVQVANVLEAMPAKYRDVIILRHLDELSFPEIAIRMNRTVDSVKKLWARALIQMRTKWQKLYGHDERPA